MFRCSDSAAVRHGAQRLLFVLLVLVVLVAAVVLAVDHLTIAVAQDLSSRYCPHSKSVLMMRGLAIFAPLVLIALVLLFVANRAAKDGRPSPLLRLAAYALLLFAIGSAALVAFGLTGCVGTPAEGLIWEWP